VGRRASPEVGSAFGSRLRRLALLVLLVGACAGPRPEGPLPGGSLVDSKGVRRATQVGRLAVEPSGVRLWYERAGPPEAPAVVLLNGNDSQAIYWPAAFVGDLLGAGFQVIRYDDRDAGLSEWLGFPEGFDPMAWTPEQPPPYPLEALASDLLGLLDRLGISDAHLVGVSMGGMVAQLVAIAAPQRVRSLTLLASTPSNPYDPELGGVDPALLAYLREQSPRIGRAAALGWLGRSVAIERQTQLLEKISGTGSEGDDGRDVRAYVEACWARAGMNARSSQGFAVASAGSRIPALERLHVPTLIVHGRDDVFFGPAHARALVEAIPDARLIWVDAGHGFPVPRFTEPIQPILDHLERAEPSRPPAD